MLVDQTAVSVVDDHNSMEPESFGPPASVVVQPIPIQDIDMDAQPWKRSFDEKVAKDLAESLKADGLLHPVTVRANGGKYQLIAGRHRVAAAKLLAWESIHAVVLDADDRQSLAACIDENLRRKTLSGAEKSEAVAKLRQAFEAKHGKTSKKGGRPKKTKTATPRRSFTKEAAKKLGKSQRTVQRIEARDKAVPEVKEALGAGRITETQVDELVKLSPEGQAAALLAVVGKTRDETRDIVGDFKAGGDHEGRADNAPANQVTGQVGHGDVHFGAALADLEQFAESLTQATRRLLGLVGVGAGSGFVSRLEALLSAIEQAVGAARAARSASVAAPPECPAPQAVLEPARGKRPRKLPPIVDVVSTDPQ